MAKRRSTASRTVASAMWLRAKAAPEEQFGTAGAEPQTGDRHRPERGARKKGADVPEAPRTRRRGAEQAGRPQSTTGGVAAARPAKTTARTSHARKTIAQEVAVMTALQKLYELIDDIEIAMMTTRRADGHLVARDGHQKRGRGADLWFVTAGALDKLRELEDDPHVNLSYYKDANANGSRSPG